MRDLTIKVTADTAQAEAALGRVDKHVGEIDKSAGTAAKSTDKMQLSLKSIAGVAAGFVALQSVFDSIVGLGSEILRDADALSRMSDQTGIGVVRLQQLKGIADQSGNTIEQLTGAINKMQNRLAEGNTSAVAAVGALGLSLQSLKAQSPDEQFLSIARAVAEVEAPAERTRLAMDLFGPLGAQILPSLRAEVDKIAESTATMSAETVRKLDAAGDAWAAFYTKVKVFAANAIVDTSRSDYEAMMVRMGKAAELAAGNTGNLSSNLDQLALHVQAIPVGDPFRAPGLPSAEVMEASDKALKKLSESIAPAVAKAKRLSEAWAELTGKLKAHTSTVSATTIVNRGLEEQLRREDPVLVDLDRRLVAVTTSVRAWGQELPGVARHMTDFNAAHERTVETMTRLNDSLVSMPVRVRTAGEAYRQELGGAGVSFDGFLDKLRTGITNIPQFMGQMQASLTGKLTSLFGASADSVLGSVVSGGLNFVFGPLGGLASKLMQQGLEKLGEIALKGLKKIGGFFKDLFGGPSGDELAGREVVAAFESNIDSMLSDAQRVEAGTDEWKKTVIFLRDEYARMGLSQDEALTDAERLWKSSKDGAEAAARVIEEIKRKYSGGIDVPIRFPTGGEAEIERRHQGGMVDWPRAHRGLAVDEVPIIALRGEGILNRGAMARVGGAPGLRALNSGSGVSGATVVNISVSGYLDSQAARAHLAKVVRQEFDSDLQRRRRMSRG